MGRRAISVAWCALIAGSCEAAGTTTTSSALSDPTPTSTTQAPPRPTGITSTASPHDVAAPIASTLPVTGPTAGMVEVPSGAFAMGCEGQCNAAERPVHEVRLSGYFIDRTEVTVADYCRCSDAGACKVDGLASQGDLGGNPAECNGLRKERDQHPINCVSWAEAEAFCAWAGKRLPTEAEWEKAARGADRRTYPWGEADPNGADDLVIILNLGSDEPPALSSRRPHANTTWPVGSKPAGASPYGALDMVGNVWEWTADWFDDTYYTRSPATDPQGPDSGHFRVIRGDVDAMRMRVSQRAKLAPGTRLGVLGFRCARSIR